MKKLNKKGFTLVELLAVIVILSIILLIAVPNVIGIIEKAKKDSACATGKMLFTGAEYFKLQYTTELAGLAADESIEFTITDGGRVSAPTIVSTATPTPTLGGLGMDGAEFNTAENLSTVSAGTISISNSAVTLSNFIINGYEYATITKQECTPVAP